jgi:hypothetical protein
MKIMCFEDFNSSTSHSLSRVWQYLSQGNKSFGIISPYRSNKDVNTNKTNMERLKSIVKNKLGLGYREVEGGYNEIIDDADNWVVERTLIVPNITKKDLITLGKLFEQDSVIFKEKSDFIEICTKGKDIGKTLTNFDLNNFDIDNNTTTDEFFSRLIKGTHRNKKFIFKPI